MNTSIIPEYNEVLTALTGRKGLRTTKPKMNGFIQYCWRMSRYHAGIDVTMPIVCEWDFSDWLNQYDKKPQSNNYPNSEVWHNDWTEWNDRKKEYIKIADEYVDKVCIDLGLNPNYAAIRWGRAMGIL